MRKGIALILAAVLLLSGAMTAFAADTSREFFFELSVDGSDQKRVQTGDVITVVFTLHRTDSEDLLLLMVPDMLSNLLQLHYQYK